MCPTSINSTDLGHCSKSSTMEGATGSQTEEDKTQSVKATKINREDLRRLEISNPIPLDVIELPSKVTL